jgi:hypothetical protein
MTAFNPLLVGTVIETEMQADPEGKWVGGWTDYFSGWMCKGLREGAIVVGLDGRRS